MSVRFSDTAKGISGILALVILSCFIPENACASNQADSLQQKTNKDRKMSFRDPLDGAFDMSMFLKSHTGFMPIPIIVTQPALGYGGGAALVFFHPHKKKDRTKITPNMTGVFGLGTQNKTWAAGAFHFHVFGPDRVRSLTAVAKPYINIDYYGNNNEFLSENPVELNLDAFTILERLQVRLAASNWFIGFAYLFFRTNNSLDTLPDNPLVNSILKRISGTSTISLVRPELSFDSRDNLFTPTKGINGGLSFAYNATWLGADDNFSRLSPFFFGFQPITKNLYSGWRFEGNFVLGTAPAYALPFIQLRGIPAMKYQSDITLVTETEWRYQFYKRWSVLGFGGIGKAFPDFGEFGSVQWVYSFGTGFRYELARVFGIHSGLDFAWGDGKDFAFYIVFGSSWPR